MTYDLDAELEAVLELVERYMTHAADGYGDCESEDYAAVKRAMLASWGRLIEAVVECHCTPPQTLCRKHQDGSLLAAVRARIGGEEGV